MQHAMSEALTFGLPSPIAAAMARELPMETDNSIAFTAEEQVQARTPIPCSASDRSIGMTVAVTRSIPAVGSSLTEKWTEGSQGTCVCELVHFSSGLFGDGDGGGGGGLRGDAAGGGGVRSAHPVAPPSPVQAPPPQRSVPRPSRLETCSESLMCGIITF